MYVVRVELFSDIDSLMWIMCVILEEPLTEMPQYISVTRGMCGVISRTDSLATGGAWGFANKNLLGFFLLSRGSSYLTDINTCMQRHALTCRQHTQIQM